MADDYAGNEKFYQDYAAYVVESRVRRVHDTVLEAACMQPAFRRVIDLGCGRANEFFAYTKPAAYVGLDKNAHAVVEPGRITIPADYRELATVEELIKTNKLTAAVSLFSAEITQPAKTNHQYYEDLFAKTGIKAMLIGGFYYEHAKGEEKVQEAGGLWSYQTHADIGDRPATTLFNETRIALPCPSTFFGEDVTEIWRLLQRPDSHETVAEAALAGLAASNRVQTRMAGASYAPAVPVKSAAPVVIPASSHTHRKHR